MDLNQRKLNKSEWSSIEIPVVKQEIDVLNMIIKGYDDVNIRINNNNSIFTFLKIEYNEKIEDYIFNKYLRNVVDKVEVYLKQYFNTYKPMKIESLVKLNSIDRLRLDRFDELSLMKNEIYEFVVLNQIEKITENFNKSEKLFHFHYFTLYKLIRNNVIRLNRHLIELTNRILVLFEDSIKKDIIIENAYDFIERNVNLLKYSDLMLYEHQKEIFTVCKNSNSKLVLYMAPTGTGKTLTPIALSEKHKIIFVCAARHVGLALARSAISVNKKVAFAFGCASADDIRLHYFAAKEFTTNRRTGGIGKVDNSVGDKVEIMICDIKSYLPAMYYMLAFFSAEDIIMYWDEPTITLDYDEHEFHKTIRKNWKKNIIPNVVLSSATLPKLKELTETISDFQNKFPNSDIYNIVSHDCKKSIPIINKDGFVILPHYLDENYNNILKIAEHCTDYLTLLRYFDLKEVVEFITYVNTNNLVKSKISVDRYFDNLDDFNMKNIKMYYIEILKNILPGKWETIYECFKNIRNPRIIENNTIDPKGVRITRFNSHNPSNFTNMNGKPLTRLSSEQNYKKDNSFLKVGTSGVYVTTKDAYTLTDGPTIFISNDVEKIAKFCIQQANIPAIVMDEIMKKIEYNNIINERINLLESEVDEIKEGIDKKVKNDIPYSRNKSNKDPKKVSKDIPPEFENKGSLFKLNEEINTLKGMIKPACLNDGFIPNRKIHLDKWAEGLDVKNAFTSNVDEQLVNDIMALNGIADSWKILLMMGIGVFINHDNIAYTEIMKKLADEQKLYLIISSSDYIYGTNYQFCHGFLSKDLNLTQEKIIQAMGRIGRNNIQQTYTVRFRDDEQIFKLFTSETEKPEIINMNILFNSNNVKYENGEYIEMSENESDNDDNNEQEL